MTITPTQARELLQDTTPAPWKAGHRTLSTGHWYDREVLTVEPDVCEEVNETDQELIVAAPDMATQIANMTWEYAIQAQLKDGGPWKYLTYNILFTEVPRLAKWHHCAYNASAWLPTRYRHYPQRIVRRLVSEAEVME